MSKGGNRKPRKGEKRCDTCQGSGSAWMRTCPTCFGRGVVAKPKGWR
jgi:DnaJ-class molecular chaperone